MLGEPGFGRLALLYRQSVVDVEYAFVFYRYK
jgi:hypothetical protein